MERFAWFAALTFLIIATGWYVLMIIALTTGSGDYKYDAVMGTLFLIMTVGMLNLSRRK